MNKKLLIVSLSIILIIGGIFGYKYYNENQYKKHINSFVVEAYKSYILSCVMCEGISTAWQQYIFDDKKYFDTLTGRITHYDIGRVYCSNFSDAIHKLCTYYSDKGYINLLNQSYDEAKCNLKSVKNIPKKHIDLQHTIKNLFITLSSLRDYSISPEGNLTSYNSKCNELASDFKAVLNSLEIEASFLDFNENDVKEKTLTEIIYLENPFLKNSDTDSLYWEE